jgi:hypothetical protein
MRQSEVDAKVGDHVQVRLYSGESFVGRVTAIVDTLLGRCYHVAAGNRVLTVDAQQVREVFTNES